MAEVETDSLTSAVKWYRGVSRLIKELEGVRVRARNACLEALERAGKDSAEIDLGNGRTIVVRRMVIRKPVFDLDRLEAVLRDYKYGHLIERTVNREGLEEVIQRQDVPYADAAACVENTVEIVQLRTDEVTRDAVDDLGNDEP